MPKATYGLEQVLNNPKSLFIMSHLTYTGSDGKKLESPRSMLSLRFSDYYKKFLVSTMGPRMVMMVKKDKLYLTTTDFIHRNTSYFIHGSITGNTPSLTVDKESYLMTHNNTMTDKDYGRFALEEVPESAISLEKDAIIIDLTQLKMVPHSNKLGWTRTKTKIANRSRSEPQTLVEVIKQSTLDTKPLIQSSMLTLKTISLAEASEIDKAMNIINIAKSKNQIKISTRPDGTFSVKTLVRMGDVK